MTQKKNCIIEIILGILLFIFTYNYVITDMYSTWSDYYGHTYIWVTKFANGEWLQGWMEVPHCLWHILVLALNKLLFIPREVAAGYVTAFSNIAVYFILHWMLLKYTHSAGNKISSSKAALISFALTIVQAIYIPWLDAGGPYFGVLSINPVHNPTQMCVRPFVLLSVCLVYDIWGKQKNADYKGTFFKVEIGLKKYYIILSSILFVSVIAKPTFVEMYVPAIAFIMLGELIYKIYKKHPNIKTYFFHCLKMFFCACPALLYICLQFADYYIFGAEHSSESSVILTEWLQIWKTQTENVPLSILLGMAFPLFVIVIDIKFFLTKDIGRMSLVAYLIGFLEAAILGESGDRFTHGNFLWPIMSAMLIVWVVTTFRIIILERTQSLNKIQSRLINCAWAIFCLHVVCGISYIIS